MKKKLVASLLCGIMTVGAVTVPAGAVQASEGTTITVMASQDWVYDAEMELGKQFEEETGIKVDYQIVPADQYYNMLMTKLNSGEGPDIFGGQSGSFDIVPSIMLRRTQLIFPIRRGFPPMMSSQRLRHL